MITGELVVTSSKGTTSIKMKLQNSPNENKEELIKKAHVFATSYAFNDLIECGFIRHYKNDKGDIIAEEAIDLIDDLT